MLRYRKLTSSFDRSRYSAIVQRSLDRVLYERRNRDPLDRFSALNAWAELPRDVEAVEGAADEAQLRRWLDEGWLRPTDLVEIDGRWFAFDEAYHFEQQLAQLALQRRARLHRRLAWALVLAVGFILARWLFFAVRRVL